MINILAERLGTPISFAGDAERGRGLQRVSGMDRLLVEFLLDPRARDIYGDSLNDATQLKDVMTWYVDMYSGRQYDRVQLNALNIIKHLWYGKRHAGIYPFLHEFYDKQFQASPATFYKGYRDHFVHQLRVFNLGLYLYLGCPVLKSAVSTWIESVIPGIDDATSLSMFVMTWKVASLFHDVGYLFEVSKENVETHETRFVKILNEYTRTPLLSFRDDSRGVRPSSHSLRWGSQLESRLRTRANFVPPEEIETIDNLAKYEFANGPIHSKMNERAKHTKLFGEETEGLLLYFDFFRKHYANTRDSFVDHGIVGALALKFLYTHFKNYADHLLKQSASLEADAQFRDAFSYLKEIANDLIPETLLDEATSAIALHNVNKSLLDRDSNLGRKAIAEGIYYDSFSIRLDTNPISFLLCLADYLQDWGRPRNCAVTDRKSLSLDENDIIIGFYGGKILPIIETQPQAALERVENDLKVHLNPEDVDRVFCGADLLDVVLECTRAIRENAPSEYESGAEEQLKRLAAVIGQFTKEMKEVGLLEQGLQHSERLRRLAAATAAVDILTDPNSDDSLRAQIMSQFGALVDSTLRAVAQEGGPFESLSYDGLDRYLKWVDRTRHRYIGDTVYLKITGENLRPFQLMVRSIYENDPRLPALPLGPRERVLAQAFQLSKDRLFSNLRINLDDDPDQHESIVAKTLHALRTGSDEYDLVTLPHRLIGELVESDLIEPLDQFAGGANLKKEDYFFFDVTCSYQASCDEKSRIYGVPFSTLTMILCVRKNWKDLCRIPDIETWSDFFHVVENFGSLTKQKLRTAVKPICVRPKGHISLWYEWLNLVYGSVTSSSEPLNLEESLEFLNEPEVATATQKFFGLKEFSPEDVLSSRYWDEEILLFKENKLYMCFAWTDSAYDIDKHFAGDSHGDIEFVPIPRSDSTDRRHFQVEGWSFFIPKNSKNKQLAFKFAQTWATDYELQKNWTLLGGCSPLKSVYELEALQQVPYIHAFKETISGIPFFKERHRQANEVASILYEEMARSLRNTGSFKEKSLRKRAGVVIKGVRERLLGQGSMNQSGGI